MMHRLIGLILLIGALSPLSVSGELNVNETLERQRRESVEFNKSVTDAEILEFLKFQYEIDPEQLQELQLLEQEPDKLEAFLENYRASHNQAGIPLPTLKNSSPEELDRLRQIFEYKKKEYDEVVAADAIINSLTAEQAAAVVYEGEKLLDGFKVLSQESAETTVKITTDFPDSLDFLELDIIYLDERNCRFFAQKGIGRGVGLIVSRNGEESTLASFNEYVSWDRTEVVLR